MSKLTLAAAFALALVAAFSSGSRSAPFVAGNDTNLGRTWAFCDSFIITPGKVIPFRSIYLVEGATTIGQQDSIVNAWHAGGATPKFRRIHGMRFFCETTNPVCQVITVFHPDGTSANGMYCSTAEMTIPVPLEADSLHVSVGFDAVSATDFNVCVW